MTTVKQKILKNPTDPKFMLKFCMIILFIFSSQSFVFYLLVPISYFFLIKLLASTVLMSAPVFIFRKKEGAYIGVASFFSLVIIAANLFYYLTYQTEMTLGGLEAVLNSNFTESYEYILDRKNNLSVALGIMTIMMGSYVYLIKNQLPSISIIEKKIYLIILVLLIPAMGLAYFKPHRIYPVSVGYQVYEYFSNVAYINQLQQEQIHQDYVVKRRVEFDPKEIHVIVIGESMRKAQLPHYGYHRETTPRLDTVPELIYFNDVISPATLTIPAISSMLTSLSACEASSFTNLSVLLLAQKIDFKTVWISNQCRIGRWEAKISAIAEAADDIRTI